MLVLDDEMFQSAGVEYDLRKIMLVEILKKIKISKVHEKRILNNIAHVEFH